MEQRRTQGNGAAAQESGSECQTRIEAVASKGIHNSKDLLNYSYAALEDFGMRRISSKQLRASASGINAACNAQDSHRGCEG